MAEERKIPGMYYDVEKKKYFKILPNRIAPKGAKYSKSAAREEEKQKQNQQQTALHEQNKAKATVKRSKLLTQPLAASVALSRELGNLSTRVSRETVIKSTWGLGLNCTSLLDFGDNMTGNLRTSNFLDSINGGITTLLKDEATGTFVAGGLHEENRSQGLLVSWAPEGDGTEYTRKGKDTITCEAVERMTTLCISPSTRTLISSTYGQATGNTVTMTQLKEPYKLSEDREWPRVTEGPAVRCRLGKETHNLVTSCTVSPPGRFEGTVVLATGQNFFVIILGNAPLRNNFLPSRSVTKDILAVEFLSDSLLGAGCRDGSFWLHDLRSEGKAKRLQFPSAITHVKAVDEHRVLVGGMEDHMHMYDLRFSPPVKGFEEPTRPYLSYPAYRNSAYSNLGLDLSKSLGLIAAATEHSQVVLHDVWTGKIVEAGFDQLVCRAPVQCLSVVGEAGELDGVGDGRSLLVGNGNVVEEWGWRRPRYPDRPEPPRAPSPAEEVPEWTTHANRLRDIAMMVAGSRRG